MGKITIIGVTESPDWHELSSEALQALHGAEVIFASARHAKKVKPLTGITPRTWQSPLSKSLTAIKTAHKQGKKIAVLATGDPMFFGIGTTLTRHFGKQVTIFPAIGAFAHATAALGWRSDHCIFTTLHGRPLQTLRRHLSPGAKILILSHDSHTPRQVADYLQQHGHGDAEMHVLCDLGSPKQKIHRFNNIKNVAGKFSDLNTIAVALKDGTATTPLLSDSELHHDGQITKEEIRAVTLMRLRPFPGGHLWDIGAGCGSVSLGWMLMGGTATAIEKSRTGFIKSNAEEWGVADSLTLIKQDIAKVNFAQLPTPDAVFWGGGIASLTTLEKTYKLLKKNGIFVANSVTTEAFDTLRTFQKKHGGTFTRLQIESMDTIGEGGKLHSFKPSRAVHQFHMVKP